MLEKEAAKAKRLGKGMITLITFLVMGVAAFQIHRLWRASLVRAVNKYSAQDSGDNNNALDRSTADAPPSKGSLPDVGGPSGGDAAPNGDSPANGDAAPGPGAEPNPADAPAGGETN